MKSFIAALAIAAMLAGSVHAGCSNCGTQPAGCGGIEKASCGSRDTAARKTGVCAPGRETEKSEGCAPVNESTACAAEAGQKHAETEEAEINTGALKALIDSGTKLVILDARSGKYDDGNRIPGARSLAPGAPAGEVSGLIPDKDALIVTYCGSLQCPASRKLAGHLKGLGYKRVLEYPQGIGGWIEAGNKVVKDG